MSSTVFVHRLFPGTTAPPESTSAEPESNATSPEPEARYPKRKRADVQYTYEEDKDSEDESEVEYMLVKRHRPSNTKPRPKHKIFPFMSLSSELRNMIYKECLPTPTKLPPNFQGDKEAIWLCSKQRFYRKTIKYLPSVEQDAIDFGQYGHERLPQPGPQPGDEDYDSDAEQERDASPKTLGFNLLSVCKHIYDEAAPMMYHQTLVFTDVDALFAFAAALSPRTAKLLRSIEIRTWSQSRSRKTRGYNAMAMLAAKGVTNLTKFFINCEMGWFEVYDRRNGRKCTPVPKRIAKKVYRDCHLWLEAVGLASGDLYKGVEVLKLNGDIYKHGALWEEIPEEEMKVYKKELRRLLREGVW